MHNHCSNSHFPHLIGLHDLQEMSEDHWSGILQPKCDSRCPTM